MIVTHCLFLHQKLYGSIHKVCLSLFYLMDNNIIVLLFNGNQYWMSNKIGGCVETYTWPSSIPISDQSKHLLLVFSYDSLNSWKLHQMECDSLQYGAIIKLNNNKSLSSYLIYEAKVVLYYQNLGTSNHRKPFIFCLHDSQYLCLTRY